MVTASSTLFLRLPRRRALMTSSREPSALTSPTATDSGPSPSAARGRFCYRVVSESCVGPGRRVQWAAPHDRGGPMSTADDFTSLMARARGGDRDAADRLIREYEPKVRLVARVLLGPALRPYLDS